MMKSRADDEDYWNNSKFKAFTFDDEEEVSRFKESKRAVNSIGRLVEEEDDEEEVEKVTWSGEPVGSISWSVRETEAANRRTEPGAGPPTGAADPPSISRSSSGYSLSSLFKGKAKGGTSLSFPELDESPFRLYAPEIRKPRSECQDFVTDWSPEESSRRLQQGQAVPLEKFRSLRDKMWLLDSAVSTHDGNVITAVLIHLRRTLSKEVLFRELESRPAALRHFIQYLSEGGEQRLLLQLLGALGRREEAALLQYKEQLSIADQNKRRDFLKSCLSLPFSAEDSALLQDQLALLERQILLQATDRQAECGGKFPRSGAVVDVPLITTLAYCCLHHYRQPEAHYSSPLNVRHTFKLSEKQFFMTALAARAQVGAWPDVDALFTSRNWLGFSRKKSPLSFQRVVDILHQHAAPTQVLQDYVALVEDAEARISLAQKHKCHDIVINTYRDLKDRQQLIAYRGKVERGSAEERKVEALLSNPQIRWKN